MDTAGQEVDKLLVEDPPNTKEAWRRLKGWYKATVNRAPPPAQGTLERIAAERIAAERIAAERIAAERIAAERFDLYSYV